MLVVDDGNNGSADFTFARSLFSSIVVGGDSGADTLLIDEINGVFTDTEATSLHGGNGNDTIGGGGEYQSIDQPPVKVTANPSGETCIQVMIVRSDGAFSPLEEGSIACTGP